MPTVVWVILSLLFAGGAGVLIVGCRHLSTQSASERVESRGSGDLWAAASPADQDASQRERLRARLEALARSGPMTDQPSPNGPREATASPAAPTDYVCPKCGTKTPHTGAAADFIARDLAACRGAVQAIKGLAVSLDESRFCAKCYCAMDDPSYALDIAFEGQAAHQRFEGVTSDDVTLLAEFLEGSRDHRDRSGTATPLGDHVVRIAHILGVPIPQAASPRQADLRARLVALARTSVPDAPSIFAMCYETGVPPTRADYVCPKCGERTLYTERHAALVRLDLPAMRRAAANLDGLSAEVDESEFCRNCRPDVAEPKLALLVYYRDALTPHRLDGVSPTDIEILVEFLAGETTHQGDTPDEDSLLRDHVGRIAELLGVQPLTAEERRLLAPPNAPRDRGPALGGEA
jgi:DNA-directed RNA polymerase subunit RPC12/RpoP